MQFSHQPIIGIFPRSKAGWGIGECSLTGQCTYNNA